MLNYYKHIFTELKDDCGKDEIAKSHRISKRHVTDLDESEMATAEDCLDHTDPLYYISKFHKEGFPFI